MKTMAALFVVAICFGVSSLDAVAITLACCLLLGVKCNDCFYGK